VPLSLYLYPAWAADLRVAAGFSLFPTWTADQGSLRVTYPNLASQNSVFFYCGIKYGNLHADVSISDGSPRKIIFFLLANLTANLFIDNSQVLFFIQKPPLSLFLLQLQKLPDHQ